jgi:hypothetical protein
MRQKHPPFEKVAKTACYLLAVKDHLEINYS